ncbi:MAG TPA: ribonuclease H-like domain-containing protein [Anaerovoracaceae bacterium]|nr:ribonuclease H-like domain-containing protein [Anaerovoracaceae bacterium]
MYSTSESYKEAFYQSNVFRFYFDDLKLGVIDIETTGLDPDRSHFILGGLVVPDTQGKKAIQLFSESNEEEASLIRLYLSELKDIDVLISYNGDHFDLPYLNRRIRHNRIPVEEFPLFQSFDLYRILDKHSTFRKLLPNLKQKTMETFLGLWSDRTDEISGAESVELYHRFLKTGDPSIRDIILLHNKDDILQLSRLMKVFDKLNLHEIMFHTGFIVSNQRKKIYIRKIELRKDSILVSGIHKNIPMDYRCYQTSHEAVFSGKQCDFTLRIPWKNKNAYSYIDLEEFIYDCSELKKYPGYQSGYLLIKGDDEVNYAEVNHLIKLLLKEILKEL